MNRDNLSKWLEIAPGLIGVRESVFRRDEVVLPPRHLTLRALELLGPDRVRVVVLGQDPYHHPGKASGLAFGYHREYAGPADSSLANVIAEVGGEVDRSLESWIEQGVLLINTRLSVAAHKPMSHANLGWEQEIQKVLKFLADCPISIVWLLWGAEARKALDGIQLPPSHLVIATSHPCKYSNTAGRSPFTGSKCFERANEWLVSQGQKPIKWSK